MHKAKLTAGINHIPQIPVAQQIRLTGIATNLATGCETYQMIYRHAGSSSLPSFHPSRNIDQMGYNFPTSHLHNSHSTRPLAHQLNSRHIHLFDPEHPQRPHPTLMPHFIQLFFEQLGAEFAFISYEEILGEFWEQTLSPLLANCIAAMASRSAAYYVCTYS